MVNQKVFIGVDSTVTDANGAFSFTSIPINTVVNVRIPHDINPTNGVDVVDLLVMRRHILGLLTTSLTNIQLFAGDTNDSGDVDATDLLIIKRLLLGVSTQFPISSWHFVPKTTANDPNFPANITIPDVFQVTFTATTMGFDFIAVKTGDVNGSADGNQ